MQFLFLAKNITHLFPIQSETFDFIYDGEDVMAQASKSRNIYVIFILFQNESEFSK